MDLNEEYPDLYVPLWFDKQDFELVLSVKLTDKQFQKIKKHFIDEIGVIISDKISDAIRPHLFYFKEDKPELFKI